MPQHLLLEETAQLILEETATTANDIALPQHQEPTTEQNVETLIDQEPSTEAILVPEELISSDQDHIENMLIQSYFNKETRSVPTKQLYLYFLTKLLYATSY